MEGRVLDAATIGRGNIRDSKSLQVDPNLVKYPEIAAAIPISNKNRHKELIRSTQKRGVLKVLINVDRRIREKAP